MLNYWNSEEVQLIVEILTARLFKPNSVRYMAGDVAAVGMGFDNSHDGDFISLTANGSNLLKGHYSYSCGGGGGGSVAVNDLSTRSKRHSASNVNGSSVKKSKSCLLMIDWRMNDDSLLSFVSSCTINDNSDNVVSAEAFVKRSSGKHVIERAIAGSNYRPGGDIGNYWQFPSSATSWAETIYNTISAVGDAFNKVIVANHSCRSTGYDFMGLIVDRKFKSIEIKEIIYSPYRDNPKVEVTAKTNLGNLYVEKSLDTNNGKTSLNVSLFTSDNNLDCIIYTCQNGGYDTLVDIPYRSSMRSAINHWAKNGLTDVYNQLAGFLMVKESVNIGDAKVTCIDSAGDVVESF